MIEWNDRAGIGMGLGNCFKGRQFTAEVILWAVTMVSDVSRQLP